MRVCNLADASLQRKSGGVMFLSHRIVHYASDDVATTVDGIRGIDTRARSFANA